MVGFEGVQEVKCDFVQNKQKMDLLLIQRTKMVQKRKIQYKKNYEFMCDIYYTPSVDCIFGDRHTSCMISY